MKYRIKSEAAPFINKDHITSIMDLDGWKRIGIDINGLEKVEPAHITYGHARGNGGSLCGWSQEDGSKFHFTIQFPSMKWKEYDDFTKGKNVRGLMDKIQNQLDYFYQQFIEKTDE